MLTTWSRPSRLPVRTRADEIAFVPGESVRVGDRLAPDNAAYLVTEIVTVGDGVLSARCERHTAISLFYGVATRVIRGGAL